MKVRTFIFWSHLVAGVLAGLVILMMSVTGVLLTYERQITAWAENRYLEPVDGAASPLSADELFAIVREAEPDAGALTLTYGSEPGAVLRASAGRGRPLLVDPYSGEILHRGPIAVDRFFSTVMYVHRWFALTGDSRAVGRAITGYSNLLFFFLLCTGVYLWLPPIWSRVALRTRMLFNGRATTPKARDYNWHHVFSFWALIPLFFVITTAWVFYFPWANSMLYGAFGEKPPERRQSEQSAPLPPGSARQTQAALLDRALNELEVRGVDDWRSISIQAGAEPQAVTRFRVDRSIGGQPDKVVRLTLDSGDGSVAEWRTFADSSPGSRARSIVRFLHTGEALGFVGQTLAGLASLAACFLVWTGLALAWRRLVRPLYARQPVGVAEEPGR